MVLTISTVLELDLIISGIEILPENYHITKQSPGFTGVVAGVSGDRRLRWVIPCVGELNSKKRIPSHVFCASPTSRASRIGFISRSQCRYDCTSTTSA